MPYVQSERAILYSFHRSACSRGLQAGRERGLVPGLCVERRGLLEMLISCSVRALQSCALPVCVRSDDLIQMPRSGLDHSFIVEGRHGDGTWIAWCFVSGGGVPSPIACHCGGMVDEAVLSLVHWSGVPVTPGPVSRGSSCGGRHAFLCRRCAGCCMFDRRGVPRPG